MPILDRHTFDFFSRSAEQTRRIGARLGRGLQSGDLVCLQGDLGAGKTTFAQGVAQGWGSLDGATSPTFVLVNEYSRPDGGVLFHLDGYRLESPLEAEEMDMDRMLKEGALLIEWPERMQTVLPDEELRVLLEYVADEQRRIQFIARGARYDDLIERLQQEMFGVS
ncbi:MAG TPA: tRNA (adenosine(37)-N6)-threonylcarbamoyltransferase complex ATPase subunit type 1 TsaE [Anaerolineales bacterium]|nr:tRNA (adenosine(37)-N6)-threonylcarbamoyltransferase complex ATPase subunit type 1 TsaE [Anaerolineales bacterium]